MRACRLASLDTVLRRKLIPNHCMFEFQTGSRLPSLPSALLMGHADLQRGVPGRGFMLQTREFAGV